jgi:hypothetical protein
LRSEEAESTRAALEEGAVAEGDGDNDDGAPSQKLSSPSIPDSHTSCSREDSRSSTGKLFERCCVERRP